ncbi:hypothetical protein [Halomarina litorea]|uniref:hypothetical protein n=1 Tax=Halomarina litorea TaxID=2961595 RepID=UPI0020C252FE|nr:hypothetical protein [Halomarina sp. BCD28]
MSAIESPPHIVDQDVSLNIDIPEVREYESEADADLDRELLDTIEAARKAGNDYLAKLLTFELGSHYWENR